MVWPLSINQYSKHVLSFIKSIWSEFGNSSKSIWKLEFFFFFFHLNQRSRNSLSINSFLRFFFFPCNFIGILAYLSRILSITWSIYSTSGWLPSKNDYKLSNGILTSSIFKINQTKNKIEHWLIRCTFLRLSINI